MSKLKKVFKNDWGKFEAVLNEEVNFLHLTTTYPAPNSRDEIGWTIKSGVTDTLLDASYDGIELWIRYKDDTALFSYLEIGGNQLEALRQHLNQWHENRLTAEKRVKEMNKRR